MIRIFLATACLLSLAACSLPRVIVLNDPLDARQHNDLGVSYQARGEYDLARREYEAAAEDDEEWARPLINLGNVAAAQEQWGEAAAHYRRALNREPDHFEAMNNLAWVLLQKGAPDRALRWAERATAGSPGNAAYLDTLLAIQLARGEKAAAAETLRRALGLDLSAEERQSFERQRLLLLSDPP